MNTAFPTRAVLADSPPEPTTALDDAATRPINSSLPTGGEPCPQATVGRLAAQRILLIGEDPLMIRTVERLLQRAGYLVWTDDRFGETRGPEDERPALVIVDLPDDWVRATARFPLPKGRFTPPVLWISSQTLADLAAPYALIKPFTASDLLDAIKALLNPSAPVQ